MLKKTITYTDFDDVERTEDFYFNLSKTELMEMNFSEEGGMEKLVKRIIDTKDIKKTIEVFKEILLKAYGQKSDDGKRFIKTIDGHRLADDFAQSSAYDELFFELINDEQKAADFVSGIIPKSLAEEAAAKMENVKLSE